MNPARLAVTAVVATIVDMVYGFVVYATLLGSSFGTFSGVYRPSNDMSHMGYLVLGVFIIMFVATFIFTRGYEGGAAVPEGLRFGCVMGTLMIGINIVNFAMLNIGRRLTLMMCAAGFVEFLILGVAIALVAKPAPAVASAGRPA